MNETNFLFEMQKKTSECETVDNNDLMQLNRGGLRVLSLFDGMSCGMLALQKANMTVLEYNAYEIDKYAIKTTTHNFPAIKENGDVFKADYSEIGEVDILMGGSPCTYWSICKTKGRETEASGMGWEMFSQYVRALMEVKPKYFIYENNKSMSQGIQDCIDQAFGFSAVCINSALVSAQNRQRLYWVGKRNDDNTYSKIEVEQPEDRGILLQDILDGMTDRTKARTMLTSIRRTTLREYSDAYRNTLAAEPVNVTSEDKARTIKAQYAKTSLANLLNGAGHYAATGVDFTHSTTPVAALIDGTCINVTAEGKSHCLRATYYKDGIRNLAGNNIDRKTGAAEPVRIGTYPNEAKNKSHDSQQYRIYDITAKSVTLCGNGGGMGAKTGLYALPIEYQDGVPTKAISGTDGKTYNVYRCENGMIEIKGNRYPIKLSDGYYIIRKLTVTECKRLQTVPDWYEFPVSDTQAYKMLGNGWTVDVIAHILEAIKRDGTHKLGQ